VEFLKLKEVCAQTTDCLEQRCLEADLIVVDGKEIGSEVVEVVTEELATEIGIKGRELNESQVIRGAGEKKVSLVAFGHWIEEIQLAWERLGNLGVQEFVFITGNAGQNVVSTEVSAVQEPPHLQESSSVKVKYQLEAEAFFRTVGTLPDETPDEADGEPVSTLSPIPTNPSSAWHDSFEDENIRAVFIHLQRHGSVTENELTQFLGGARKARSFSLAFEEYLKKVPFSVRIETTASGKRYIKET
jgi:hypothetical protein